jgi:hypothetical protein
MGKAGDGAAVGDRLQQAALRLVAGRGDRFARQHGRRQQRFEHQAAAQRFEDDGDIEAAAAEAAVLFAQQDADGAQFGEVVPHLGRIAFAVPAILLRVSKP